MQEAINQLQLGELDKLRRIVAKKITFILGFWCLVIGSALTIITQKTFYFIKVNFSKNQDYEVFFGFTFFLLIIYLLAGIFLNNKRKKTIYHHLYKSEYLSRYKTEVIGKLISIVQQDISYSAEKGISRSSFAESGFPLFGNPSRYFSSGAINGKIGKTEFTFAEILAEDLAERRSSEQYMDLFRGLFIIANLKKNTAWNTLIYPDAVKYFSPLLLGKLSDEKQKYSRVKLEDIEFEKYFEVYGTDQVESRYLLSPAFMSRIVDLKKRTKKDFQFSFKDSKVYFGIYYPKWKNLFTPPLFGSIYKLKPLEKYFDDIRLMLDIIKELNLNSNHYQDEK